MHKSFSKKQILEPGISWFASNGWKPLPYQKKTWNAFLSGKHGIVNAPTGSGKTYSLIIPILLEYKAGLRACSSNQPAVIWISPIRALTKEIKLAAERAILALGMDWSVGVRSGDTSTAERNRQWKSAPQILITTPESLHILMAKKGYRNYFSGLGTFVVDEWHELMGSKRGVQVELALSRLKVITPDMRIWGISATIGNLPQALEILLGDKKHIDNGVLIKSNIKKKIKVQSIYPKSLDKFPWSGHLGLKLLHEIIPILRKSESTLIFTNTRGQCEIWYQKILAEYPEFAGVMAMHHGSVSRDLRSWVEDALYEGRLKAVVCTSSLDLGVDFRPVESIIQIGGPKGVARFMQRAGRSGHSPNKVSKIYFVPTNAMEFIEASALRKSIEQGVIEKRMPYIRSFDVLIQYLMTLALSEGFVADELFDEVTKTHCFASMSKEEWGWILSFLQFGGPSLQAYDEYKRLGLDGRVYRVMDNKIARRHRMSIGTIVSAVMMSLRFTSGKRIGNVEEWFVAQFKPGDTFWFAGQSLELVRVKDLSVIVRKSNKRSGNIPSWLGGRLSLTSEMSEILRNRIYDSLNNEGNDKEMKFIQPLLDFQKLRSHVPNTNEFLIEYFKSDEGYHLLLYPFEGRSVHEAIGALLAYRLSKNMPITFSIAMNDYGVELLSDQKIDIRKIVNKSLLNPKNLISDVQSSVNAIEIRRQKFRDISRISGLIFEGFPGQKKKDRHLQNSTYLLFDVFQEYEPDNLLFLQAHEEAMTFQFEEVRLRRALNRIQKQKFVITEPDKATPFSFAIIVDRMRAQVTSEKLEDRIAKMTLMLES